MKKLLCLIVILTLVFALAACNGEAGLNPSQEMPETSAPADTQTRKETTEPVRPEYFGEWTVQEAVGFAQVSTGVDGSMLGKKAIYLMEKASFDETEVLNPVYEEAQITSEQFIADYRIQLNAIGIDADPVKIVTIKDWTAPGSLLLIKDDQTLITLWDGTFYSLEKN